MGIFDFFNRNKKKCKCGVKIDIDDNYCASCVKEIADKLNADIAERRKKRESRQLKEDFKTAKIKEKKGKITRVNWNETEDIGIVTHYKGEPYTGICYSLHKNGTIKHEYELVDGLKHGKGKDFSENGYLKDEWEYKNDKLHGVINRYFENSKQINLVLPYKSGKPHGISKKYSENGDLLHEIPYKNGKIHGLKKWYSKVDGDQDESWKNNVKEGPSRIYYKSGKIQVEMNYKNEKLHGFVKEFHENGSLKSTRVFKNGEEVDHTCSECGIPIIPEAVCCTPCSKIVAQRMKELMQTPITETDAYKESKEAYDKLSEDEKKESKERFDSFMAEQTKKFDDLPEFSYTTNDVFESLDEKVDDTFTGQCEKEISRISRIGPPPDGEFTLIKGEYKNGVRHGKFQTLYENGSIEGERTYENGQENGVRSQYFYSGKLQIKSYVKNNLRQGIEEQYYESGMIKFKDNYKDDKLEGICFGYFENGQISSIEQFKNNKKIGLGITYPKVPESFIDLTNSYITRASSLQTTTLLKKVNVDWLPEIDVFDGSSLADIPLDKLRDKEDRYLLLNVPITPDSKKKGIMIGVKEIIDEEHKVFGIPLAKFLIDGLVSFLERNHSFQLVDEDGVYGYISEKLMITLAKKGDIITILPTNDEMRSMLTSNKK